MEMTIPVLQQLRQTRTVGDRLGLPLQSSPHGGHEMAVAPATLLGR